MLFRSQSKKNQAETGYEVRGRVDVDARTPTAAGPARTFVRIRGANTSGIRNATIGSASTTPPSTNTYVQSDASTTALTLESAMRVDRAF